MLVTPIYNGQGLGNQLHCYVTTRCLALDKGYEFGVAFPERFKGVFFKNIELPEVKGIITEEGKTPTKLPDGMSYYLEATEDYDPFILNIPDNYMIHGNLQGEKYFERHREEIKKWLEVEPVDMPDDLCILNFRGGEYKGVPDFFLPSTYWNDAMDKMLEKNPNMRFKIVTDDIEAASAMLPDIEVSHEMSNDWRSIRYAKNVILSNSSFGWMPAWLGDGYVIAPKFWQRHNKGYWMLEQNKTKGFWYLDGEGNLEQI